MSLNLKRPPGPTGSFKLLAMSDFRRDPLAFFQTLAAEYGDIAQFQMGPQRINLISSPEEIRRVLVTENASFMKGRFLQIAKREFLGDGLLTSEGELHQKQRRLIQPLFHRQMIHQYGHVMVDYGTRLRTRWQPGQNVNMAEEMMRLTLAIVGKTLFDADVESDAPAIGEALTVLLEMFDEITNPMMALPLLRKIPTRRRRRFQKARALIDSVILQVINDYRHGHSDRRHLLSVMMDARDTDGDGSGMSDQQIRDEALTLFLAGHETTANALSWTWYLLSQHPRVEHQFHQELDSVLQGRLPSAEDLPLLPYTRLILTESMRLYPPAWIVGRMALHDYPIQNYVIHKGEVVVACQYIVHHDPRWYDNPYEFRPERWLENKRSDLPKFAYFPFGGGPRVCVGEAFAWMEGILLLATLGQQWQMRMISDEPVKLHPVVTLRPRNGLAMRLEPRH